MPDLKMPEINSIVIAGNLTRDPVFRTTSNGNTLVSFTIAANKRYRDSNNQWQEDVCFIGVIARNKLAESCKERLKKGNAVLIEGELQSRTIKSENNTTSRHVEIKARRIQFLNKPEESGNEPDSELNHKKEEMPTEPDTTYDHKSTSFEDDSYNNFISNEESEFLKRKRS